MSVPEAKMVSDRPSSRSGAEGRLRGQKHQWLVHLVLIVLSAAFLFPLLWLVSTALKPIEETMRQPPTLIPSKIQWHNFRDAFVYGSDKLGYIPFLVYGRNTLLLCILGVSGVVVSNAVVAYSFARLRWPGRDILFAATLATMMIPFPVLMVPIYSFWRALGWIGTFKPLWVPAWFGSAFNIFLLRQFFRTIPEELTDAARIDGCSELGIYGRIILPLAKPAITVVGLFEFMGVWHDYLGPKIYLNDPKMFTIALGLEQMQEIVFSRVRNPHSYAYLMAGAATFAAPVVVLYYFAQRTFIEGIALTGLKG